MTLADTGGNTISFMQAVDGDFDADSPSNTRSSLTVQTDGSTEFDGAVGSMAPLAGLLVRGNSASSVGTTDINGGSIITSGPAAAGQVVGQTYDNAVILTANTVLTDASSHNVTFSSTVNSQNAQTWALTVNTAGNEIFNGVVGGSQALASLATDAAVRSAGRRYSTPPVPRRGRPSPRPGHRTITMPCCWIRTLR